ncbi:MAG: diacylglycerol kinase family lipid kinase, partial [Chloroflexi bacterium]|nr:diacylglycerol kinase family lipid kinase [Chloroflexota bacterium]
IILHAVPKLDLLFRLLPAVYRGAHLSHPRVSWSRAQRVRISASDLVRTEVDGEPTACGDVEFGIVPRAISVIV